MAFYVKIVEITSQLYKALKFILDLKRETDLIKILLWFLLLSTRYDKICIQRLDILDQKVVDVFQMVQVRPDVFR